MLVFWEFCGFVVTVICVPFIFGGWNFTLDPLMFNFNKLNPLNNIGNIFGIKRVYKEVIKSTLKAAIILSALFYFVIKNKNTIFSLINYPVKTAIVASYSIFTSFVVLLSYTIILIVIVDMVYAYYLYQSKSKMSLQELRDEAKETEGSGETKKMIRKRAMQLLKQRMTKSIPLASVIIVNPTHYAVAIKYDERKDRAPKLLAKGKGPIAEQIRTIAIANGIPLYEAPPLARAIYFTTKVNAEIDPDLYMAVAIVLSYVQQLKNFQMGIGQQPNFVRDLKIPEEFIYDE